MPRRPRAFRQYGDAQVFAIASEIALLGQGGLDYASSDRKYTLKSLPGEKCSGPNLMALMYVAFQRIAPSLTSSSPSPTCIGWRWIYSIIGNLASAPVRSNR